MSRRRRRLSQVVASCLLSGNVSVAVSRLPESLLIARAIEHEQINEGVTAVDNGRQLIEVITRLKGFTIKTQWRDTRLGHR